MPRHVLYAYVDGSDFDDRVASALDVEFVAFVTGRRWVAGKAWAVNQRHSEDLSHPNDLPDWDLGLNLELPDPGKEAPGWFSDVEAIARFLGRLHAEFDRTFIIGIADTNTGITQDLFDTSTPSPDLSQLKAIIGVSK